MNYIRSEGVRWRREFDTILIFNVETKELIELNPVASEVWMLLNGENNRKKIVDSIFDNYKDDISKEEISKDIDELLAGFLDKGLIMGDE